MSYLKISSDLFLETQELNKFQKFLRDDGYRKHVLDLSYEFGIVRDVFDSNFDNFKVTEGTNSGTIQIAQKSYAFDKNGHLIVKDQEDNIPVTDDNQWYWVKISHEFSPIEPGTVDIDSQGNLTGTNTKFTEVLRGGKDFPSTITFPNASSNTVEYQVLEVIDDFNAVLGGTASTFISETGLSYKVVGTFTPDYIPSSAQKDIFQYDSCVFEQILESPQGTQTNPNSPSKTQDEEFFIARVKRNGSTLIIQDKRNEIWRTKADKEVSKNLVSDNPLVGVEAVKWDSEFAPRHENLLEIGWGFRTTNFSWNSSLNKISISGGLGGSYKGVGDFSDGDFDGWRLYFVNGSYSKIIQSTTNGSQIDLILAKFDPINISSGDEITIVPDVEQIEFDVQESSGQVANNELVDQYFTFNVETGFSKIRLLVPSETSTYWYEVKYRYKNYGQYSDWKLIVDGKFYSESEYDKLGVLNQNAQYTTYNSGLIPLQPHPESYFSRINAVDTGDLFGINERTLDNSTPYYSLTVGQQKDYQIIRGGITLNTDHYINLSDTGAINKNKFILDFRGGVDLGFNNIYITEKFSGAGSPSKDKGRIEIDGVGSAGDVIKATVKELTETKVIGEYTQQPSDNIQDIANGLVSNGNQLGINDTTSTNGGYSAINNGSFVDITAPVSTDPYLTPKDYSLDKSITGGISATVLSQFTGGEIIFKLDNFELQKMKRERAIYECYFYNGGWFVVEKYREKNPLGTTDVVLSNSNKIVLPGRYKYFKVSSSGDLDKIESDYHKEGDIIVLWLSNTNVRDLAINSANSNIRIYGYNEFQTFYPTVFIKRDIYWYLVSASNFVLDTLSNKVTKGITDTGGAGSVTFGTGWGVFSNFSFYKDYQGYVFVTGVISGGSSGTVAFTFDDSKFHPDTSLHNYDLEFIITTRTVNESAVATVKTNGDVVIDYANNDRVSLSGICFKASTP